MPKRPRLKTATSPTLPEKLGYVWAGIFIALVAILLLTLLRP